MSPSPSKPPKLRPSYTSLPPPINTSLEDELRHCNCAATLESTLQVSLADLRAETMQQFEAQRVWFEHTIEGEENERNMLAVENRWLRNELARIEKEKGLASVDESGVRVREGVIALEIAIMYTYSSGLDGFDDLGWASRLGTVPLTLPYKLQVCPVLQQPNSIF